MAALPKWQLSPIVCGKYAWTGTYVAMIPGKSSRRASAQEAQKHQIFLCGSKEWKVVGTFDIYIFPQKSASNDHFGSFWGPFLTTFAHFWAILDYFWVFLSSLGQISHYCSHRDHFSQNYFIWLKMVRNAKSHQKGSKMAPKWLVENGLKMADCCWQWAEMPQNGQNGPVPKENCIFFVFLAAFCTFIAVLGPKESQKWLWTWGAKDMGWGPLISKVSNHEKKFFCWRLFLEAYVS